MKSYKFVVNTECAIEHDEKFLIIKRPIEKHAGGLLSFPGGKFEATDACNTDVLKSAVKREVREEVGLELLDSIHYITSAFFEDTMHKVGVINTVFYCKLEKTLVNVVPSTREVPEYYWLTPVEILSHNSSPKWLVSYIEAIAQYS